MGEEERGRKIERERELERREGEIGGEKKK